MKIEQQQKERLLYFNRYLMIRYMTAVFFFANLYWLFFNGSYHQWTILFPILLLILIIPVWKEQFQKYYTKETNLTWTKRYYYIQSLVNIVLLISLCTPIYKLLLPFVNADFKIMMIGVLICGLIFCFLVERKIIKLQTNQDRYFKVIKQYENQFENRR